MSVPFTEVPNSLLVPGFWTEFDNSMAGGTSAMPWKVLLIGQQTKTADEVVTQVFDEDSADAKFGKGSQIALMVRAFRKNDKTMPLYVLPLKDAANGTAEAVDVTFEGTATESGNINLYIGGKNVSVAVTTGDTASAIATAVKNAVSADESLFVTASVASGVVTLTAKNKGIVKFDVRVNYASGEILPGGITASVSSNATGSNSPSFSTLAVSNLIKGQWFNIIVNGVGGDSNVTYILDEVDDRWEATDQKTGVVFMGVDFNSESDPVTAATTYYNGKNNKLFVPVSLIGSPTTAFEIASAVASVCASKAQNDPALPLSNWAVKGILAPAPKDDLSLAEKNVLLNAGCALIDAADDRNVYLRRMVTTYKKNAAGGLDTSYQQLETILTLSYIRWDWNNLMSTKYPHAKLGNDGGEYGAGQVIMTPKRGYAEALARFKYWMEKGLVQDYDSFKENLVVERNADNKNRLDFLLPVNLMNQLFTCASLVQFR